MLSSLHFINDHGLNLAEASRDIDKFIRAMEVIAISVSSCSNVCRARARIEASVVLVEKKKIKTFICTSSQSGPS